MISNFNIIKLFVLCFLLSVNGSFLAQGSSSEHDIVSRFRPGVMWFYTGLKPAVPEKVRKYDRLIFDLVYNDWIGKELKPFNVSPFSIGFNSNLMFDIPVSKGNRVSLGAGLAYGFYHVRTNNFFTRNSVEKSTDMASDIKQYGIEKSVFNINSFVPLELRFRGRNWKHLKLHLGAKFSYQFRASTQLVSNFEEIENKQETIGFYDLNPINVSSHIRIGIRNWAIFASYSFLPVFKNSASIELKPLQLGISISLF